jgi:dipeptidase
MLPIYRAARNCYVRGQTLRWVHDAPDKAERFLAAVAAEMLWSQARRDQVVGSVFTDPTTAAQAIEEWFDDGFDCPDEHDTAAAWWKAAAQEQLDQEQPAQEQPAQEQLDLEYLEQAHQFADCLESDAYSAMELVEELTARNLDGAALDQVRQMAAALTDGINEAQRMVARLQEARLLSADGTVAALEAAADEADTYALALLDLLEAAAVAELPRAASSGKALARVH